MILPGAQASCLPLHAESLKYLIPGIVSTVTWLLIHRSRHEVSVVQAMSTLIDTITAPGATIIERHEAFAEIVARFQDMAYGCAYAVLGDSYLAEDAAQEAFITAWQKLPQLREPEAFPGWFRRIVLTQCNRLTRAKRLPFVPLDASQGIAAPDTDPGALAEKRDLRARVLAAIKALPENERMVTTLFYVDGYTHADISAFLEVPTTTVAKRLHNARARLKESLEMFKEDLQTHRPSRDDRFAESVNTRLRPFAARDWEPVAEIAHHVEPDFRAQDDGWLRNRQSFDETKFIRRHYVAEHAETKEPLGYGSIEQGPELDRYRMFLIVGPERLRAGVGDLLFNQLMNDLRELKARTVWVRHYAHVSDCLDFLRERGFEEKIFIWDLRWYVDGGPRDNNVGADLGVRRTEPIYMRGRTHRSAPTAASGIAITTFAQESERDPQAIHKLHEFLNDVKDDDPRRQPFTPRTFASVVAWFERADVFADACFIAKHGEHYVGFTDLNLLEPLIGGISAGFTGVAREYRRQGIATALKLRACDYAREQGYKSIRTFNHPIQTAILSLNEKLGFKREFGYVTLEKAI